jgi:hypothetical protein
LKPVGNLSKYCRMEKCCLGRMGDSDEYDYECVIVVSIFVVEDARCNWFHKLYTVVGVHLKLIGCIIWMLLIWMVLQNCINKLVCMQV